MTVRAGLIAISLILVAALIISLYAGAVQLGVVPQGATSGNLSVSASGNPVNPGIYGVNVRSNDPEPTNAATLISQTPISYLRYPGGIIGERENLTTNAVYNYGGGQSTATFTTSSFINLCIQTGCKAIIQLPLEINSPSTAAFEVNFIEADLHFRPAYWELGNEPGGWSCFNSAWTKWPAGCNGGTDSIDFAQETKLYIAAVRSVDPSAQFVGLGGTGAGSGNNVQWITPLEEVNGPNLAAISIHSYVDGSGPAAATLSGFFSGLSSQYAVPNILLQARQAILAVCSTCSTQVFITEMGSANGGGSYGQYIGTYYDALFLAAEITEGLNFQAQDINAFAWNQQSAGFWNGQSVGPKETLYSTILSLMGTTEYNATVSGSPGVYTASTEQGGYTQVLIVNTNGATANVALAGSQLPTVNPTATLWAWTSSASTGQRLGEHERNGGPPGVLARASDRPRGDCLRNRHLWIQFAPPDFRSYVLRHPFGMARGGLPTDPRRSGRVVASGLVETGLDSPGRRCSDPLRLFDSGGGQLNLKAVIVFIGSILSVTILVGIALLLGVNVTLLNTAQPAPLSMLVDGQAGAPLSVAIGSSLAVVVTGGVTGGTAVLCTSLSSIPNSPDCYTVIDNGRFDSTGKWTVGNPPVNAPQASYTYWLFASYKPNDPSWTGASYSNAVEIQALGTTNVAFYINGAPLKPTFGNNTVAPISAITNYPNSQLTLQEAWVYPCSMGLGQQSFTTNSNGFWETNQTFSYPSACPGVRYATLQAWVTVGGFTTGKLSIYVYYTSPVNRLPATPPAPTNLTAMPELSNQGSSGVQLRWTQSPGGNTILNDSLYYGPSCSQFSRVVSLGVSTSYVLVSPPAGPYCFEVTSWNVAGESSPSNTAGICVQSLSCSISNQTGPGSSLPPLGFGIPGSLSLQLIGGIGLIAAGTVVVGLMRHLYIGGAVIVLGVFLVFLIP